MFWVSKAVATLCSCCENSWLRTRADSGIRYCGVCDRLQTMQCNDEEGANDA